jgi:alpha-N-arabinofuranosidase
MYSRHHQPRLARCTVTGAGDALDVSATLSRDGRTLVLQAVNPTDRAVPAEVRLSGYAPGKTEARVTELSGELEATNSAARPGAVVPRDRQWSHGLKDGRASYSFPPRSVTVITWE